MWEWEADLGIVEHLDSGTLGVFGLDGLDLEDVDAISLSTMTGSHVTVALSNSSSDSGITVLTVHVVVSSTGIVLKPDSVVLDGSWVLLEHLKKEFSSRFCKNWQTCLIERISPLAFFTRRSMETKYQKRDLAITWLVAKICIFQIGVTGSFSVGILRPTTTYSLRVSPRALVGMF
ncbi:hypothetical protein GCK72_014574 [Caenorhabditis remanei]|uniref:Uncharacterized protein n=1 Tax=Caenorhabditis remanei TaxID=31234 RepID=A0A6A5GU39_CAERE|nr:hypothetical protein GCK72_014574 [Caenorhabditis remanei]KAF1758116.1 hypothetical protein GCK72_014574 [Caenorhabditis remanei]